MLPKVLLRASKKRGGGGEPPQARIWRIRFRRVSIVVGQKRTMAIMPTCAGRLFTILTRL